MEIAKFNADAAVRKAEGDAQSKTINATADAQVTKVTGDALAERTTAVGGAEAEVMRLKTAAVGQNNYALIQVGTALAENKVKLVPEIVAGGSDGGSMVNGAARTARGGEAGR